MFLFFAAVAVVASLSFPRIDLFEMQNVKAINVVVDQKVAVDNKLDFIANGSDAIVTFDDKEKAKSFCKNNQPKCVVFVLPSFERKNVENFLNISYAFTQELGQKQIVYGWSSKGMDEKIVDCKKINVQLVVDGENMLVGFPMIMTGF